MDDKKETENLSLCRDPACQGIGCAKCRTIALAMVWLESQGEIRADAKLSGYDVKEN